MQTAILRALRVFILVGVPICGVVATAGELPKPGDSSANVRLALATGTDNSTAGPATSKSDDINEIVVTGSLIRQKSTDAVSPKITVTSAEIEDQGFANVYDALRNLPIANGFVEDAQFTGGFTPGANAISLFGLDPSFTLTLLNGRPKASYPLPNNGVSDLTDIANLPVGLIDHIDILTGAQSSIYGSSAIAGVVNVVLKDKVDGTTVSVRDGGYSIGGGRNQRVQLVSGFSRDKLDAVYGVEYTHQEKLLQNREPGLSQLSHGQVDPRAFLTEALDQNFRAFYVDPTAATCAKLGNLYGGTLTYTSRPGLGLGGGRGYYCGSPAAGFNSVINQDDKLNGLLTLKYHITDNMTAYTELLYARSAPTYSGGLEAWNSSRAPGTFSGFFDNQNTGQYELWQRIFSQEESGGWNSENQHVYTHEYNGSAGLKGSIGDSGYNYDLYFHDSQENTHYVSHSGNFKNQLIADYFLGPNLGPDANGISTFAPDPARLYAPLTPAQLSSFGGTRSEYSLATTHDFTLNVNNPKLFSLPAGDVGGGAVAQYGGDSLHEAPDPQGVAGVFDGFNSRPNSAGTRSFYAAGGELKLPLLSNLTADISGRYDHYNIQSGTGFGGGNSEGKFTYKAGLEFRPFKDLLLRAGYGTAFRTPDLHYLFEGPTTDAATVTDWYQCRKAGYTTANISQCPLANSVNSIGVSSGSTQLQNLTAKTFNYGFVWSAFENHLRWSVDYDRIDIANEVQLSSNDAELQTEANCRLGQDEHGNPFDINSKFCQNAQALIDRNPPKSALDPFSIQRVTAVPQNFAVEHQAGIQSQASYNWATNSFGSFQLSAGYFRQLQHTLTQFAGDAPINLLANGNLFEFTNITTANVIWNIDRFSTTLHATRDGATDAANGSRRNVAPWTVVNASEKIRLVPNVYLQLIVNNIANKQPPSDPTNGGYPYFNEFLYNGLGRAYWIELEAKLGGKKQ
jgi:outer membrane receptor protein involved in Fe transport